MQECFFEVVVVVDMVPVGEAAVGCSREVGV